MFKENHQISRIIWCGSKSGHVNVLNFLHRCSLCTAIYKTDISVENELISFKTFI